jgi:hypothetical protein
MPAGWARDVCGMPSNRPREAGSPSPFSFFSTFLHSVPENAYFQLYLKTDYGKNTRFLLWEEQSARSPPAAWSCSRSLGQPGRA